MPINNWNFYRSFSTGADLKAWNSENPQVLHSSHQTYVSKCATMPLQQRSLAKVEDGRDGGNPEFDGEVTDQYTAEVRLILISIL